MIITIDKKYFPCTGDYNRISVAVLYNNIAKEYSVIVSPEKIQNIGGVDMVSVVPSECSKYVLERVNRRTKKRDKMHVDHVSEVARELAEQMEKKYNVDLETEG